MKVIIDIPEKDYYQGTLSNVFRCYSRELDAIIYNGTVLPKGHGRLIDADALKITKEYHTETDEYNWNVEHTYCTEYYTEKEIKNAPTIIEGDSK